MSRQHRATIAAETVNILQTGTYSLASTERINITDDLQAACAGTLLYLPDDYAVLRDRMSTRPTLLRTDIVVNNRTTLAAGRDLTERFDSVACLNFASARNPGGGFLGGSQAQEESLARASGLYATLQTQAAYYNYHQHHRTPMYSDRVIFSPGVPVFRDDTDSLITPWKVAFLTAAAPNAGVLLEREPDKRSLLRPMLAQRARMVLAVAAANGCEALVLGAWGCGVFRNDPQEVAEVFAAVLAEAPFAQRFAHIEFAVFDTSSGQRTYQAFKHTLSFQ